MKDNIPQFLQKKISLQKNIIAKKFPEEIKQFMVDYAKYYNWQLGDNYRMIFKLMKQGTSNLPECELDSCSKPVRINHDGFFLKGCCRTHAQKASNLKKYGVENPMHREEIVQKIKDSNLAKYGVTTYSQTKEYQSRLKDEILPKIAATNILRYGVPNVFQSEQIKQKIVETNISKYGKIAYSQTDTAKERIKKTNIERYGVEYPSQNPEIHTKSMKNSHRYKEYIWQTGEVSLVQGYETIVLAELENQGYRFQDVLTSASDMPEIYYEFEGCSKRYIPDFFIPEKNLVIEVKSEYTLKKEWDKNQAKFEATKQLGYNFSLEVR